MPSLARRPRGWGRKKPPPWARINGEHPLSQGLVACWMFNEAGGAPRNLVDRTLATATGTPTWTPGRYDGGLANQFTAAQSYNTGFGPVLNDFGALVVYKATAVGSVNDRFVDKAFNTGFWLGRNASNANTVGGGVQNTTSPFGIFITLPDNAWHDLAATRAGTTHTIIGDGGAVTNSQTVAATATDTTPFRFGLAHSGGGGMAGLIDHVLVWKRAPTLAEFAWLRDEPFAFLLAPAPRRIITLSGQLAGSALLGSVASLTPAAALAIPGSVALVSTATLSPTAGVAIPGSATLAALATLSPTAGTAIPGTASLVAIASLSAVAGTAVPGAAILQAVASLAPAPSVAVAGSAALAASASLTAAAGVAIPGSATLASLATLIPTPALAVSGSAVLASVATLVGVVVTGGATVLGCVATLTARSGYLPGATSFASTVADAEGGFASTVADAGGMPDPGTSTASDH